MEHYSLVHVVGGGVDAGRVDAPVRWSLNEFAGAAGLHPELVRRFVALGLLMPDIDDTGGPWFVTAQLARIGRILRLRAGLGLNYAAVGVVLDLLDRIDELEAALRASRGHPAQAGRKDNRDRR